MKYSSIRLDGPIVITLDRHFDSRGFFSETYQQEKYSEIGIPNFVQDNLSSSGKGVFRGLHWQRDPYSQGKLVTCLEGSIVDFVVDIRPESNTFLEYEAIPLSGAEPKSVWVPEGFAHGFLALEDRSLVHYKVTAFWEPSAEQSLSYKHINLSDWFDESKLIISNKDMESPETL